MHKACNFLDALDSSERVHPCDAVERFISELCLEVMNSYKFMCQDAALSLWRGLGAASMLLPRTWAIVCPDVKPPKCSPNMFHPFSSCSHAFFADSNPTNSSIGIGIVKPFSFPEDPAFSSVVRIYGRTSLKDTSFRQVEVSATGYWLVNRDPMAWYPNPDFFFESCQTW